MTATRWIDMPPVWLAAALVLAWGAGRAVPEPAFGVWADWAGGALVVAGLALIGAAAREFLRARSSIVPHMQARVLITTGIFRWSRNPIYLADVMILAGVVLLWGPVLPLVLVPALAWILRVRFIEAEEARLRAGFGGAHDAYAARTRRWI